MTYRVYSGPPGTERVPPMEKERWLYKEFGLLDDALGWARHVNDTSRVALPDRRRRRHSTEQEGNLRGASASGGSRSGAKRQGRKAHLRRHAACWQPCLADLPFVALATSGATGEDMLAANPQQRLQFAVDADVDIAPGLGADEMQPFHGTAPPAAPVRADDSLRSVWPMAKVRPAYDDGSQCGERLRAGTRGAVRQPFSAL